MNGFAIVTLALTVGAPAPKEAAKKAEVPAIVGEWECVEFVGGGRRATPNEVAGLKFTYEFTADGKYRYDFGGETGGGTYTIDPAKTPAHIDTVAAKANVQKGGLYRVEDGMLTLCFAEGKGARPEALESPAGTRIMLTKFKRAEKKKE